MWDFERDWECYNGCCNSVIERSLCGPLNALFVYMQRIAVNDVQ